MDMMAPILRRMPYMLVQGESLRSVLTLLTLYVQQAVQ